jgi:hypothetical protein
MVREPPMYDTLLSVCLFVAGLCTAATLLMQHPARSLGGPEVAIVDKGAPSTRTEVAMTVEASAKPPLQVPAPPKTAKKPEDPTPKDVDVAGSVKSTAMNNQGRVQAESKPLDRSNHKSLPLKPRRYGWEPYPPWPPGVYRYPWMDEYRGW